jgi:SAM-dependent methyltransferase
MPAPESAAWDKLAAEYATRWSLQPPERALLARLRERWAGLDVLDLGVGAGRTAFTFAALARDYVGLDFSPQMIEHARRIVGENEHTRFLVGDARNLSAFRDRRFGLVLFSFNGIDALSHEDRLQVLQQVRTVIADQGIFAFSCHSLLALPFSTALRRPSLRDPIRSTVRSLRRSARLIRINRRLDLDGARARGWARIRDEAHDFSLVLYYVMPATQIDQLHAAGFEVTEVLNMVGRPVPPSEPGASAHLFWICRPVSRT